MTQKISLLLLSLSGLVILAVTLFKPTPPIETEEKREPYAEEETPVLLVGFYDFPVKKQDYIDGHLAYIKFNGRNQNALDGFDALIQSEEIYAKAIIKKYTNKDKTITQLLKMDVNHDKVISKDEVSEHYPYKCRTICFGQGVSPVLNCKLSDKGNEKCTQKAVEKFIKKHDLNGDNNIDTEEIRSLITDTYNEPLQNLKRLANIQELATIKTQKYLQIDPDQDDHLTIDELEKVTSDFFDLHDSDKNGILSEAEGKLAIKNATVPQHGMYQYKQRYQCGFKEDGKHTCLPAHEAYRKLNADKTPLP